MARSKLKRTQEKPQKREKNPGEFEPSDFSINAASGEWRAVVGPPHKWRTWMLREPRARLSKTLRVFLPSQKRSWLGTSQIAEFSSWFRVPSPNVAVSNT